MSILEGRQLPYVIAEIGINHCGRVDEARKLIDAAVAAGVDAVKFQVRSLADIYTKRVLQDPLKAEHGTQYLLDQIRKTYLSNEEIADLKLYTESKYSVDFFATPFDLASARFLRDLGVELFKVGSPDLTNLPLIREIATYGKPIILSTGMATEQDIIAVADFLRARNVEFYLLHCNSTYPASLQDINLSYLLKLREITGREVGYSGHEQGFVPTLAAVALGARIIERHITFDREQEGPDHRASLTPSEFGQLVAAIKDATIAVGRPVKVMNQGEANNRLSLGKSLVYGRDLRSGDIVTARDLVAKTPAKGISPLRMDEFIGKRLCADVEEEQYLSESHFSERAGTSAFRLPRTWGIVGRLNDFRDFLHMQPDLVEIHLTWRDLVDFDIQKLALAHDLQQDLVVHAPEYYQDKLIDFTDPDPEVKELSLEMLSRTFALARQLAPRFKGVDQDAGPRVVVHPGGHFKSAGAAYNKNEQYRLLKKSLMEVDSRGLRVLVENMPPFPWYFGGQWYNTVFLDPREVAQFASEMKWGICYDLSHAQLYCNHAGIGLRQFTSAVLRHVSYLHISDGAGTTQEGLQLGEGDLDFEHLAEIFSRLNVGFIPEIWQGHLDGGLGFRRALETIEIVLKKVSGESCQLADHSKCSHAVPGDPGQP